MKLERLADSAQPWDKYVEQSLAVLPQEFKPVFKSALAWTPRKKSWGWTIKKTMENVANASKPMAYGFSDYYMIWAVNKIAPDLETVDTRSGKIAYLRTNQDLAMLAKYIIDNEGKFNKHLFHFMMGVILGYPLQSVYEFASTYDSTPEPTPQPQEAEVGEPDETKSA